MFKGWIAAVLAAAVTVAIASGQGPGGGDAKQAKGDAKQFKGKGKAAPIVEEPTMWIKEGVPDFRAVWNTAWIVNMADGRYAEKTVEVPLTEKGAKLYAERTGNLQKDDPNMTCKPSGMPRQMGVPYPMKMVQTDDEVIFLFEGGMHTFRIVPVGPDKKHKPDAWTWYGDPVGHYEGPELVIDTNGFNDEQSWLDSSGYPHSEKLHLVERFRRLNANTMRYTVTIEDPEMYTKPWSTSYLFRVNPGTEIMEYWCTENEKDRIHMFGK